MSNDNEDDDIEDDDDHQSRIILRSITEEHTPRGNISTGFYYNPSVSFYDYKTAYLNALLLLGIFQTPQDLKPYVTDYHPIQAILRNASKHGFVLKIVTDIKSAACSFGVLLCRSHKIWYAMDITNKKRVDTKTGEIVWAMMSHITLIYKIEKQNN
jgi:hypothetical protein